MTGPSGSVVTKKWHYYKGKSNEEEMDGKLVFAGSSDPALCSETAKYLGIALAPAKLGKFKDGEISIEVRENVEGKDCIIIQPVCRHENGTVNDSLMELLLMISCLRRAAARTVAAVIPYFGYARQDRKLTSGVPISAADIAHLLTSAGVTRVVSIDLHCGQIQGFFPPQVPVDNLSAGPVGAAYFAEKQLRRPVVVSPDAGGVTRAREFRSTLSTMGYEETGLAMISKHRVKASVIERMDLVGEVSGSDCIIVDDMTDTSGTLCEAAKKLKEKGALRVFAYCTHGLLSPPAGERIKNSVIEQLVIANTVPLPKEFLADPVLQKKVQVLSLSPLIAECIRRMATQQSLQATKLPKSKL